MLSWHALYQDHRSGPGLRHCERRMRFHGVGIGRIARHNTPNRVLPESTAINAGSDRNECNPGDLVRSIRIRTARTSWPAGTVGASLPD
jgi:hypothetical protein